MFDLNQHRRTVRTIDVNGNRVRVQLHIRHDGIEYVGRLGFLPEGMDAEEADRGALPGREVEDVIVRAEALSDDELVQRYKRALSEKRRYRALRRTTTDILDKIRQLNEIGVAMRAGLVEADGAADDLMATERSLHALVNGLRTVAGTEDNPGGR
jgi:hypothetical protein